VLFSLIGYVWCGPIPFPGRAALIRSAAAVGNPGVLSGLGLLLDVLGTPSFAVPTAPVLLMIAQMLGGITLSTPDPKANFVQLRQRAGGIVAYVGSGLLAHYFRIVFP